MSDNCRHTNSLKRSGTARHQRLLNALLPSYVSVDERKIDDLKEFVNGLSKKIRFHKHNTSGSDTSWEGFFDKSIDPGKRTDPHYALFMGFLQLFKIAQNDLNQITAKHLNYYYRDVLQLREKPAEADQVFIIFELARHVHQHVIPKGTELKAGKDESGKELLYQTDRDIVLNKALATDFRSVFKDGSGRLYQSPVANSSDGLGAEIETSEMSWKTFGNPSGVWPDQDREQAQVGFAVASPYLKLAEGDRVITLTIHLKENDSNSLTTILKKLNLKDAFRVRFSGEKTWIEPEPHDPEDESGDLSPDILSRIFDFLNSANTWKDIAGKEPQFGPVFDDPSHGRSGSGYDFGRLTAERILKKRDELGPDGFTSLDEITEVAGLGEDKLADLIYTFRNPGNTTTIDPSNKTITLRRTITKAQDPIVSYLKNEDALTDPFQTEWPVMKVTLHTNTDPYQLNILQQLEVEKITLSAEVTGVRELVVQNDQSIMDPAKNFHPFGTQPVVGSGFYIGSTEVFGKSLKKLSLHLTWHGLPDLANGFTGYYQNYIGPERSNNSFKAGLYLLDRKNWIAIHQGTGEQLFTDDSGTLSAKHTIDVNSNGVLTGIQGDANLDTIEEYETGSKKGFLKLELSGTDFGHKDYTASYTQAVLNAFNGNGSVTADTNGNGSADGESDTLPKEPYTPALKEISIDYTSVSEISSTSVDDPDAGQFFHVGVFGVAEQHISPVSTPLVEQHTHEGILYIGIEQFTPGQNLSLLFKVAEGSADPDLEPQPIKWAYLSNNQWIAFDEFDILSDSTSGLLTSGIIQFNIPKKATSTNTLMPAGKHWLRAVVRQNTRAISDMVQITAQAVPATFKDNQNDPGHLSEPLEAETISKLKEADSAVSSVMQPFSSFGGALKEKEDAFYTRISERLRHKRRAITLWDYERLVLEAFPSVYKVKCLNHTRFTGGMEHYSELAPGHVTLVVISNVTNVNAVDPLRPKTSLITLSDIHNYLSAINSECVELHVKNPVYEEIEISLNVRFHEGYDNGFYAKQLEDDLKVFLSPWSASTGSDLELGGKIHKSVILNYVEERPYTDFITCFEMRHIILDPVTGSILSKRRVDEAVAGFGVSILGSAGQLSRYGDHRINVLETDDCECDTNEIHTASAIASRDDCGCGGTQNTSSEP